MEFYKYHGAGNDFVLIDNRTLCFEASRERVAALCHRRTGVGADGLMLLESDEQQEFLMRYFNADGGEATMCGNGGRCITLFAHHLGIGGVQKRFRGVDGVHTATVLSAEGECGTVRLGMTEVSQMEVASDFYFLNTGSPHYVTFVPDVRAVDVAQCGATIRWSPRFAPEGTNVNFVQILAPNHLRIRTFERGVEAETLACGTGATASALAAAVYAGNSTGVCRVEVEGGVLEVAFRRVAEHHFDQITLTGPACRVFTGRMAANF